MSRGPWKKASKKASKARRARLPCGCFKSARGGSNDYGGHRHRVGCALRDTVGNAASGSAQEAINQAKISEATRARKSARATRRILNLRTAAVAAFPWDSVRLVPIASLRIQTPPGFRWNALESRCSCCGDDGTHNPADGVGGMVDMNTLTTRVCGPCYQAGAAQSGGV